MRKILSIITLTIALTFLVLTIYRKDVIKYVMYNVIYKYEVVDKINNNYRKEDNYSYVQATDNFYPKNKQEILNAMYTAINNGWGEFFFVCSYQYDECENDVKSIASNEETLTNLNNFVNPYNSYDRLRITINGFGKISMIVDRLYSEDQIAFINTKVDEILATKTKATMTVKQKIKAIHDYVIDITTYDQERAKAIKENRNIAFNYSNIAYGILKDNKAVCGGYADLMAIFLDRLNVENYKISSEDHIWNLVYLDNTWSHLDLTWDDPVYSDGYQIIDHKYFFISTAKLESYGTNQHVFNKDVFTEAK